MADSLPTFLLHVVAKAWRLNQGGVDKAFLCCFHRQHRESVAVQVPCSATFLNAEHDLLHIFATWEMDSESAWPSTSKTKAQLFCLMAVCALGH